MSDKTVIMKNLLPDRLIQILKTGPCRLEPVFDEDGKLLYTVVTQPAGRGNAKPDPRRTQPL